jgi:hypothetical protein
MSKAKARRSTESRVSSEVEELLYQALETELGGVEVYRTALKCVQNEDLREEWEEYLEETEEHARRLQDVCKALGLDPDLDTPGRQVVRATGTSLVKSMLLALGHDDPGAGEIVAAESVVLAETKDHMNWSLLGKVAQGAPGLEALAAACAEVEEQEDEHLYHSQGWARELWLQALGLPAQLPPPEEEQDVKSAGEAARVKEKRGQEVS